MTDAKDLSSNRRRRGVVKASITRLEGRVFAYEEKERLTRSDQVAIQSLLTKLEALDTEFKAYHYVVLDLAGEDAMEAEQAALDDHEDKIEQLADRLRQLVTMTEETSAPPLDRTLPIQRQLRRLESRLRDIGGTLDTVAPGPNFDRCLVQQIGEQVSGLKSELTDTSRGITMLIEDRPDLTELENNLDKAIFNISLRIKRLLQEQAISELKPPPIGGVKLPKIEVPTFDGTMLNWRSFWDQFCAAVHDKVQLTDADKLAYLRHAIKDSPARHTIEGLTQTSDSYAEAIACLQRRYDRPRLIHRAHVRAILDVAPLKDGNGKEIRRLHDVANQHLRALNVMGYEPSGPFVTSILELKLDQTTLFEWQRHSQETDKVPDYDQLLNFLDLRANASEHANVKLERRNPSAVTDKRPSQPRLSYAADADGTCVACKAGRHPLYTCQKFRTLPHEQKIYILRSHNYCYNCLKRGHFSKECPCSQRCKTCQQPHHTWLHIEPGAQKKAKTSLAVSSHTSQLDNNQVLLMTCRVQVTAPDGYVTQARALLDSASSTSFVTERLAQLLRLPRRRCDMRVCGIGGSASQSVPKGMVSFDVARRDCGSSPISVQAVVLSKVTADLPLQRVPAKRSWKHLNKLQLADPDFGTPGRIDILLGADVFSQAMRHGRRRGPLGSPIAFNTTFGWVLAGTVSSIGRGVKATTYCASVLPSDELLRKFWEVESCNLQQPILSAEEKMVMEHFEAKSRKHETGRFIVPLPIKPNAAPLGESRFLAVKRFLALERSLKAHGRSRVFAEAVQEYFDMGHAEPVPMFDLHQPCTKVYYLPMHGVVKNSSATTKLRVVFDASAKTSSGVSLNDQLLVGPTVHPPLVDVLLRFRRHKIAMTTDVSRMYRAVLLPENQRDLHRFVWRPDPSDALVDYRMTRLTFGVSASSFAANMAVRRNAIDNALTYPEAAQAVMTSFYVDDGLLGASSVDDAIQLQRQLQELFSSAGFTLRKWRSSDPTVLTHLPADLIDEQPSREIKGEEAFAKVLGIEWSSATDTFHPIVNSLELSEKEFTKRGLMSDIARLYDPLGWCSPSIIMMKILMQRLWQEPLEWDEPVPHYIMEIWGRWRDELPSLRRHPIPRCYGTDDVDLSSAQLHGFSDASESAYSAVVYLRFPEDNGAAHIALVMAKTKVAPIKRLTVPRLELCGAVLLSRLLNHGAKVLSINPNDIYAWTDSTVVLGWLRGNPQRFKTFVGNRVSEIIELTPSNRWRHVRSQDNPADPASRSLYPVELTKCQHWWQGPTWLAEPESEWPSMPQSIEVPDLEEVREAHRHYDAYPAVQSETPLWTHFSNYTQLIRVTAWMLRFIQNSRRQATNLKAVLSTLELRAAERNLVRQVQRYSYEDEIEMLRKGRALPRSNKLLPFHPILDDQGILRVGGRITQTDLSLSTRHPMIMPSNHEFVHLLVRSEHLRLLHAGPTLVSASLSRRFCIIRGRRMIRAITHNCVICRRITAAPKPQVFGQLPTDRLAPGSVFERVGVDYAGPIITKTGPVRKPTLHKTYLAIFVCFTVKAVHVEIVSELTTAAFIAALRRFIARRGIPSIIWSDHGTNFVGAAKEIKELYNFFKDQNNQNDISDFCTTQGMEWNYIPEQSPHFGGLWEAAVKSLKIHLRKVAKDVKLTYEELATVTTQIEACLNSRPLTSLPDASDGIEVLTPGHFLIGRPIKALPDDPSSDKPIPLLRRWHLCQALVRHFWHRWSTEYLTQLQKFAKWHTPSRNLNIGDVVCLRGDPTAPTNWTLARVIDIYPGADGMVRVATVKTSKGTYKRPVTKIVPLVPHSQVTG